MKTALFITILAFGACSSPTKESPVSLTDTTVKQPIRIDKSQYYITSDSLVISSKHFDTIVYSRDEINEIIDKFPTLYSYPPSHPDISYAQSVYYRYIVDSNGNEKPLTFGSEAGQDQYYILYSYFLKQKNPDRELADRRETLISIYQNINSLFSLLKQGGTYYGHQYNRISAYAEYGVYQFRNYSDVLNERYDIRKQKEIYLSSLRQLILDETKIDTDYSNEAAKEATEKQLYKFVEQLESIITDHFYLKKAQEFQYSSY